MITRLISLDCIYYTTVSLLQTMTSWRKTSGSVIAGVLPTRDTSFALWVEFLHHIGTLREKMMLHRENARLRRNAWLLRWMRECWQPCIDSGDILASQVFQMGLSENFAPNLFLLGKIFCLLQKGSSLAPSPPPWIRVCDQWSNEPVNLGWNFDIITNYILDI